ncbi:chemotaxis protein CheW [Pontibacterium granulatum]|uniref:chemotaxis protein CheW n=1 Tax=Pontibacterium granulatum TaxID=2036029 RepID=UPI00249BE0EF|nr:chemotaxis protein CheW [Pontibacterium granulatum]MDI3322864.1 chemotaxis protein CheW [Pontibacterium granulatum]
MSKTEQDNEFYAPKTGNQQVVFDYLESLLEDPDTLAHDTMEELKAIGALERTKPAALQESVLGATAPREAVSEALVLDEPAVVEEGFAQADASGIEDLVEDDEPELVVADDQAESEVFSETELFFGESELLAAPEELINEMEDVATYSHQVGFEPELQLEPVSEEPDLFAAPAVSQSVIENEPPAGAEPTRSAPEITPEPTPDVVLSAAPAADNSFKPALHVADNVLNCILFQLQGLTLAIPVDDVEGAVSMERLTLHLDLEHEWVLGFFNAMGKETSVVDTGQWLLSGRFDAAKANYEEVLILKGRRWALACDTLVKSIRMSHSDIVWAGENKSRPWLLGTNMTERCAILDVDKLQMLLNQQA